MATSMINPSTNDGREMNAAPHSIDYSAPQVWEQVAEQFTSLCTPRPSLISGRVMCERGWNWHTCLPDYDLWFVCEGRGGLRVGGHTYELSEGTLFVLRPGDIVSAWQDLSHRLTVAFIHFDFWMPGKQKTVRMDEARLPGRHLLVDSVHWFDSQLTRIIRLLEQRHPLATLEATALLQCVLVEIYRQDAKQQGYWSAEKDPRIARVVAHLRGHPEKRLTLQEAADLAGMAPVYFSQCFRREQGQSFRSFLMRIRLERAQILLRETSMTINEIAHALGYHDVFLFSRQFKQQSGYSPSKYRADHSTSSML